MGVFSIFAILALEFGNFKSTLIGLTVVPLALQHVSLHSPIPPAV